MILSFKAHVSVFSGLITVGAHADDEWWAAFAESASHHVVRQRVPCKWAHRFFSRLHSSPRSPGMNPACSPLSRFASETAHAPLASEKLCWRHSSATGSSDPASRRKPRIASSVNFFCTSNLLSSGLDSRARCCSSPVRLCRFALFNSVCSQNLFFFY